MVRYLFLNCLAAILLLHRHMNKKVCKTVLNKFNSGLLELFIKNIIKLIFGALWQKIGVDFQSFQYNFWCIWFGLIYIFGVNLVRKWLISLTLELKVCRKWYFYIKTYEGHISGEWVVNKIVEDQRRGLFLTYFKI